MIEMMNKFLSQEIPGGEFAQYVGLLMLSVGVMIVALVGTEIKNYFCERKMRKLMEEED